MIQIKICGLTNEREAGYLNEAGADYAGFVFYEKSRRNISLQKAVRIAGELKKEIKRVAVCVSPTIEQVYKLEESGFDIIQIHGELSGEVLENVKKPIWRAVNIAAPEDIGQLPDKKEGEKITGCVIDGAAYGGGKTFDWKAVTEDAGEDEIRRKISCRQLILAGGLNVQNVGDGIRLFHPDVVDVSTGVEGNAGKDRQKIIEFVREVRRNG